MVNPICEKILTQFSIELEKAILKFICNNKKSRIVKTILNNKRTEAITIPDLKLNYRAIVIKTVWCWYSDRQVDQWNRIEDPEMNPHTYGHFTLTKELKPSSGKKTFLTNGAGSTVQPYSNELQCLKIVPILRLYHSKSQDFKSLLKTK